MASLVGARTLFDWSATSQTLAVFPAIRVTTLLGDPAGVFTASLFPIAALLSFKAGSQAGPWGRVSSKDPCGTCHISSPTWAHVSVTGSAATLIGRGPPVGAESSLFLHEGSENGGPVTATVGSATGLGSLEHLTLGGATLALTHAEEPSREVLAEAAAFRGAGFSPKGYGSAERTEEDAELISEEGLETAKASRKNEQGRLAPQGESFVTVRRTSFEKRAARAKVFANRGGLQQVVADPGPDVSAPATELD